MGRVKVKICGITNWEDAQCAVEAGADFLGFNFYRKSPRYISSSAAQKIIRRLPQRVSAVGVFVNESEERVLQVARAARLDLVQLHGDETPEAVTRLGRVLRVMKAVRVKRAIRPAQLEAYRRAFAILLDGFTPRQYGGTGKRFHWRFARGAAKRRIFLAGGLTPDNVGRAIRTARPYAVDVCSGVESKPGKKDPARIVALMRSVTAASRNHR